MVKESYIFYLLDLISFLLLKKKMKKKIIEAYPSSQCRNLRK